MVVLRTSRMDLEQEEARANSLSLILESCIKLKDTFAVFIDFSKAYKRINRALLWYKLSILGINGKIQSNLCMNMSNVQSE